MTETRWNPFPDGHRRGGYHSIDFFDGSRIARGRFNFFGRGIAQGGSNLSEEGATEKIEKILSEERDSWKLKAVPSAKSAEISRGCSRSRQVGAASAKPGRVYGVSRRSHDRNETLSRSLASHDRLTQTHGIARVYDVTTFILKPSHALLDDHTMWDPINESEISQRPLIKHGNRILGECSEE